MYEWLVIISCIGGFFASFGIGANDVANAISTSVGSKTLRLWQAIILASIFEFLGVVLMGSKVTATIRKGIVNSEYFNDDPYKLQLGMFCVIISVIFWLLLATRYELPVSTTHTCIGGVLGMTIASGGWDAVKWNKVYLVFASWVISPTLSAISGIFLFLFIKMIVLKKYKYLPKTLNSYVRTLIFFPFLVGFTICVNSFLFIFKGSSQLKLKKQPLYITIPAGLGVSLLSIIISFLSLPLLHCLVKKYHKQITQKYQFELELKDIENPDNNTENNSVNNENENNTENDNDTNNNNNDTNDNENNENNNSLSKSNKNKNNNIIVNYLVSLKNNLKYKFLKYIEPYREDQQVFNSTVIDIARNAEIYDAKSEYSFVYLQILSTCFDCFAHGSNDIANAIGPLAAIISIFYCDCVGKKTDIPFWIFAIGGLGLVTGLVIYGYKIVYAIGMKFAKITPSRGFSIEMSSSLIVIIASQLGIPISTTHCQIGSLFGVGLLEGICPKKNKDNKWTCVLHKSINWLQLIKILFGWVITLFIAGLSSAGLFSLLYFSHSYQYEPKLITNTTL